MKLSRHITLLSVLMLLHAALNLSFSQPGHKVDIKKPKPYEERQLKAEKTGDGKLKAPKRILQNLTTRFNYYFNASTKFNEILDRAKEQHKDDFSQLISFYNYDINATAADSAQLDSVIYKVRTGIINHDLRNEWIDELYLLWGASWHLQKKLDSASLMFQFINYAYAPQDEDGYYKFIGTRTEGAKELSIATKEDKKFLHSNTFSRNNAFIWQIRTLIEMGNFTQSGSLITTLKRDPVFPSRLGNALEEVEAYWYYKQRRWDSAAAHLVVAIDGAGSKKEKARWQYLAAQLFERAGKYEEAAKLYAKSISLTPDPVMEVYGRLNLVRISKEGGDNAIEKNLAELLKMAKKDKYEEYRDIIYYMAAQMEMERNNIAAANELLIKGSKYNNGNVASRNKAFLQIGDVSFDQKKYLQAASFYDSVQANDLSETDAARLTERKQALEKIVFNSGVVTRQDSLQRIAAMSPAEREDYISRLVKKLRKESGLKDDVVLSGGTSPIATNTGNTDLFGTQQKGEWYFYNSNLKAQGTAQFKQLWGNRPNVDNWRRFAAVSQQLLTDPNSVRDTKDPGVVAPVTAGGNLSVEGLTVNLPLTPESIKASNDSIRNALFALGTVYLNEVEDFDAAIAAFEDIRRRFPEAEKMDEVLFNLYYAYSKAGNASAAAQIKKLLQDKFPSSRFSAIATTGKDPAAKATVSPEATKDYEQVYNLFIEGRFQEAIAAKKLADSVHQTNFWQPQLLYIEAVYYVKQRNDSSAINVLQTIIRQNTNKALTAKAQNLISALARRQQLEQELNAYQMQNIDSAAVRSDVVEPLPQPKRDPVVNQPLVKKDSVVNKTPVITPPKDTVARKQIVTTPPKDTAAKKPAVINQPKDTVTKKPVVINQPKDSVAKKAKDPVVTNPPKAKDTVAKKNTIPKSPLGYTFDATAPHAAVVVLDKVDPIFISEAKNAFFRYNKEKYYNQPLDVQTINLTADIKVLVITNFANAQAATDYALKAKSLAPSEIIPWLTGNKYSFSIISAPNLEILKSLTDINAYRKFLEQHLPVKF